MFAEQKKDFYSVNADIAIEANQQQRQFEYAQRTNMIQREYQNMGMSNNFEDSQHQDGSGYGMDPMQAEMIQQQQVQLMMLDETMNGPQAVRYDEVYYPRTDKRSIRGNQYTYEGNRYRQETKKDDAVEDIVNAAIGNQEQGKSPIEYVNQLSRAKIFDMKGIRVADQVRSYSNLYQDSIPLSSLHEQQRYGKRQPALDATKRVNKATFMNQIVEKQANMHQQMYLQQQQQMQQREAERAAEEQQHREAEAAAREQAEEDEAEEEDDAVTEVADVPVDEAEQAKDDMEKVIDALWQEYDKDESGYLDKDEMVPLAQAALRQVGFKDELDPAVCDAFFQEVDSDGNGRIDKSELRRFMLSLM